MKLSLDRTTPNGGRATGTDSAQRTIPTDPTRIDAESEVIRQFFRNLDELLRQRCDDLIVALPLGGGNDKEPFCELMLCREGFVLDNTHWECVLVDECGLRFQVARNFSPYEKTIIRPL